MKSMFIVFSYLRSPTFTDVCVCVFYYRLLTFFSFSLAALPRPPDSVRISDIMSTSVRVTWSYDVSPGDVSYYVLQYKPRHADRDYAEISGLVTKFYTVISKDSHLSVVHFSLCCFFATQVTIVGHF